MFRFGRLVRTAALSVAASVTGGSALAQTAMPVAAPAASVPCPPAPYYGPGGSLFTSPLSPLPGQAAPQNGMPSAASPDLASAFSDISAGAGVGESAAVGLGGYIDNATPVTMFRLRFDSAYDNNRPDRAEFFYAKCGCFRTLVPPQLDANGPPLPETSVDYQELVPYFEYAFARRASAFISVPVRFIDPTVNANAQGLGDIDFGFKYAIISCPDQVLTFQLRAITPSGSASEGLGTSNWWLEPGLLYLRQLSDRWQMFGEVRDQIPLSPRSDFTGNVLRYGLGTSYQAWQNDRGYVAPVGEVVGWTVLSGREFADGATVSAEGDTIVNAKVGVRIGFGRGRCDGPFPTANDVYIGYGRALTGEVWYKDVLRLEYRRFF